MRPITAVLLATIWIGCAAGGSGDDSPPTEPCEGLRCRVTDCAALGRPETRITGTVLAPNGTLPLEGVTVYVPDRDPGPLADGARCARCASQVPGDPIVQTISDEMGRFTLAGAPSGEDIPVV